MRHARERVTARMRASAGVRRCAPAVAGAIRGARAIVLTSVVAAALAIAVAGCTPPTARERLHDAETWTFAIGDGTLDDSAEAVAERLGGSDLVVIDGESASPEQVAAVRETGAVVVGYLSVGTIEPWRGWYGEVAQHTLEYWPEWDEYYADVSAEEYRATVADEIAPALLGKGFDGLFLDNVDMVESHPEQAGGMRALIEALSALVREDGGVLLAQNGFDVMERLGLWDEIDGWNREDVTWTYDFDAGEYVRVESAEQAVALDELRRARERGVVTLATDYTAPGDADAVAEAAAAARSVGALPFAGDIGLTRPDARGVP